MMAMEILHVDKLQELKPGRTDLIHPTLRTNEDPLEGETENEYRTTEQRNEKRRVDWVN